MSVIAPNQKRRPTRLDLRPRQRGRRVFISYSGSSEVVESLVGEIEARGISCWYAPRDIPAGSRWAGRIVAALEDAAAFVLLHDERSNASRHCHREVALADEQGIPLWLIRLDATSLNQDLIYFFADVQHEHYATLDVAMLVAAIERSGISPLQRVPIGNSLEVDELRRVLDDAEAARADGQEHLAEQLFQTAIETSPPASDPVGYISRVGAAFAALQRGDLTEAAEFESPAESVLRFYTALERARVQARLRLLRSMAS